eukprot:1158938-Pelagomonas_calceolata.AAC.7
MQKAQLCSLEHTSWQSMPPAGCIPTYCLQFYSSRVLKGMVGTSQKIYNQIVELCITKYSVNFDDCGYFGTTRPSSRALRLQILKEKPGSASKCFSSWKSRGREEEEKRRLDL